MTWEVASSPWLHRPLHFARSSPKIRPRLTPCHCATSLGRLNNLAPTTSKPTEQKIMKRALITLTTLAVMGTSVPRLQAGDQEWATAGKVMAGVGAGLLLAKAFEPAPVQVYSPPPVYVEPVPVVYQQAPVVVHHPAQPLVQHVVVQQPRTTVVYTQAARAIVYQPAPVVYQPAPVLYAPAPVIYHPAPVYYGRPVYVAPPHYYHHHHGHHHRPAFRFHVSIGSHGRHHHHR